MTDDNPDSLSDGLQAWMKEFQDMELDSPPVAFDRQAPKILELRDSFAPDTTAADTGNAVPADPSPGGAITDLSLSEAAAAIASGNLSSQDATQACLDRIDALGGTLNCIAGIDVDAAMDAAKAMDERMARGENPGSLAGVPLAHKDALYVRSHYDTMTIMLPDAPLPNEIAIICCYANRGQLNARVGGLKAGDIKGEDGLT